MNIKMTKQILKSLPSSTSVLLKAKHGVGKSSVVKQVAKENGWNFYDVRLSQCEVGDIKGLPYREGSVMKFAKPEWFPTDPESKGILFFDEMNRASKDVLQAIFEICLDRRLDGVNLPDGWRVVSAINADDEYDVIELDPALSDRWFHIDFNPSVDEWLTWAKEAGIEESIRQFIAQNNNLLDPPVGNLEISKVYPSRRSWCYLSDELKSLNLPNGDDSLFLQVVKARVGTEVAIPFQRFITNNFSRIKPSDVLDGLQTDSMKEKIIKACESIEIVAELAVSVIEEANTRDARKMKEKQQNNLKEFFMMLPNDVASNSWLKLLQGKRTKKIVTVWQSDQNFADKLSKIFLS